MYTDKVASQILKVTKIQSVFSLSLYEPKREPDTDYENRFTKLMSFGIN